MSLEKVAAMVGKTGPTLGKIELGEVPYAQDVLERLAEVYGCRAGDLLLNDPSALQPLPIFDIPDAQEVEKILSYLRELKQLRVNQAGKPPRRPKGDS